MGYVEELRAIIGHRPIILNGCIAFVVNPAGEFLMQQRTYPYGKWGFPGGLMELGESTQETTRREILEETGLTIGELTLFGVYSGKKYFCTAQNGDQFYVVTTVYITHDYSGTLCINDDESLRLEWVSVDNLPENIAGTHMEIIGDYVAQQCKKVVIINENKKNFLDLLLLADEQEDMIDKYLHSGILFALYDCGLKSICVVTNEGDGVFEIQNLATYPQFQGRGYARHLINHVCDHFKGAGKTMIVGTGDSPITVPFYEKSGFSFSHRVENYILEHYDKPIFEGGVQLKDKVYLAREL